MTPLERRATLGLALIFVLRMLGLFMILPVFALYAGKLNGVTPDKLGLALGIYGLTQACLQFPFGLASDRLGRKPVIVAGLIIFAAGSLLAASATDINWVIAGRALQGAGAIGAVIQSLLADLTRDNVRTIAMAILGISIGVCFLLAMILGPVLGNWIGVPGIFVLTAGLALFGIAILLFMVPPQPVVTRVAGPVSTWRETLAVISDPELLRLDTGIFALHAILTALFVAVPLALRDTAGLEASKHWHVYLPVMLLSLCFTVPMIYLSDRKGRQKPVFFAAIAMLAFAMAGLTLAYHNLWEIAALLVVFFSGFNLLEASLPSLISRRAPATRRGAALGVYSSLQFLGTFCGGAIGGVVMGHYGLPGVFAMSSALAVLWLVVALPMQASPAREN